MKQYLMRLLFPGTVIRQLEQKIKDLNEQHLRDQITDLKDRIKVLEGKHDCPVVIHNQYPWISYQPYIVTAQPYITTSPIITKGTAADCTPNMWSTSVSKDDGMVANNLLCNDPMIGELKYIESCITCET